MFSPRAFSPNLLTTAFWYAFPKRLNFAPNSRRGVNAISQDVPLTENAQFEMRC